MLLYSSVSFKIFSSHVCWNINSSLQLLIFKSLTFCVKVESFDGIQTEWDKLALVVVNFDFSEFLILKVLLLSDLISKSSSLSILSNKIPLLLWRLSNTIPLINFYFNEIIIVHFNIY